MTITINVVVHKMTNQDKFLHAKLYVTVKKGLLLSKYIIIKYLIMITRFLLRSKGVYLCLNRVYFFVFQKVSNTLLDKNRKTCGTFLN